MKKTQRLFTTLFVIVLALSLVLVGCNNNTGNTSSSSVGGSSSVADNSSVDGGSSSDDGTSSSGNGSSNAGLVIGNDANNAVALVSGDWGGSNYLRIKQDAFDRLISFYETGAQLGTGEAKTLSYAAGTTLRMATGYNNADTGIAFSASKAGSGVTLADGKTYQTGELKPTWAQLETVLGVEFESVWTGAGSAEKEFKVWQEKLNEVDMVAGSASILQEAGAEGKLINLANYIDYMPNFKAYLEANPIVRLSITGSTTGDTKGAIFFSPYFDGVNDIERMPLMRVDYLKKLLDGEGDFTATSSKNLQAAAYTPYMPTSGSVEIDVVKADGSATETIAKNYDAYGNIVKNMNDALAAGTVSGVDAVNMLRDYIDATYDNYYGTQRSDLFVGQNAAWDADELVALLRCVVANSQTLNGTDTIDGFFSREDKNTQRRVDMFRFLGTLFGVRGLESRQDYLYLDMDGLLHDARQEPATYAALEKMKAIADEGLVAADYLSKGTATSTTHLESDSGFMSYDYNQTQTLMNETVLQDGEEYSAAMVPVALWDDGTGAKYFRFTESWRSVKTDGWAISKAGVEGNNDKLFALIALIDYAYSAQGQILMSYGPDAFIKVKAGQEGKVVGKDCTIEEKYETFDFNGTQMPVIADATEDELWDKASGNYTNYARYYLGSTLSFVKSQAFEIQCTCEVGRLGAQKLSVAIGKGTIKHPVLSVNSENMWWTSIPTTLPTQASENTELNELTNLTSSGLFSQSKEQTNILCDFLKDGYGVFVRE